MNKKCIKENCGFKSACTNVNYAGYQSSILREFNILAKNSTYSFGELFANHSLACFSDSTGNSNVFTNNMTCAPANTEYRVYCGATIGTSQVLLI